MTTASDEIFPAPALVKPFTAGHTPGPWYADEGHCAIGIGPEADVVDEVLCEVAIPPTRNPEDMATAWVNANLIAACPAMYDYIEARAKAGDLEAMEIIDAIRK